MAAFTEVSSRSLGGDCGISSTAKVQAPLVTFIGFSRGDFRQERESTNGNKKNMVHDHFHDFVV